MGTIAARTGSRAQPLTVLPMTDQTVVPATGAALLLASNVALIALHAAIASIDEVATSSDHREAADALRELCQSIRLDLEQLCPHTGLPLVRE